jgi:membrane protein DedA with SNARE-associated domain
MLIALTGLVSTYGYWLVFGLILLEGFGFPLPGETMLIVAGAYAATGHLSIAGVILAGLLGAILGDVGGYWIGHSGGVALMDRILGSRYELICKKDTPSSTATDLPRCCLPALYR